MGHKDCSAFYDLQVVRKALQSGRDLELIPVNDLVLLRSQSSFVQPISRSVGFLDYSLPSAAFSILINIITDLAYPKMMLVI